MFRSSKKWIAMITSACMFAGALNVWAADTSFDDSSVGISSAVERYIEEKPEESITDLVGNATMTDAVGVSFIGFDEPTEAPSTEAPTEKKPKPAKAVDDTISTTGKVAVSYDNFKGQAIVTASTLNIRKKATDSSDKVGTINKGGLVTVKEKGKEWTYITSGKVTGYVLTKHLAFGSDATKWAKNNGLKKLALVKASGLRVRAKADDTSKCITLASKGEKYEVKSIGDAWTKIEFDESLTGYVNNAYITITFKTSTAKASGSTSSTTAATETTTKKPTTESKTETTTAKATTEATTQPSTKGPSGGSGSSKQQEIAQFALQYVGNPYVYGGNSLTNGTDCSGFTMLIYKQFGVSLPHSAHLQANYGKEVSISDLQPGDLVFYAKDGSINHVALYVGNKTVVHASSPSAGIKTSKYNYRTPVKAVRLVK